MKDFMKEDFMISKILLSCYVAKGTGTLIHRNRQGHGLALHVSGRDMYTFKSGKSITVDGNHIIYLPKHSYYQVTNCIPGECYAINFDISDEVSLEPFGMEMKNPAPVLECFKSAASAWSKKNPGYLYQCTADLYRILYIMKKAYYSQYLPDTYYAKIKPAVEKIHRTYTDGVLSIDELSGLCGITPEYFRRLFKAYYGVSPLRYINDLKISHAKELIESGLYTVTQAAIQSGYNDMSYFSREFKRKTGNPPRFYL